MENKILMVENYNMVYKNCHIITDLNFSIDKGDFLAIGGVPGSGKTTLIKSILGLVTKGIKGDIEYLNIGRDEVAYMPQNLLLQKDPFLGTVREVVAVSFLPNLKGRVFSDDAWKKVDKILKKLNLDEVSDKKVNKLTKGQHLKLNLAKVLMSEPKLIFIDSPIATIDNKNKLDFYNTIKKLCEKENLTIVLIARNIKDMCDYANKVLFLRKKDRSFYFGTNDEFLELLNKAQQTK